MIVLKRPHLYIAGHNKQEAGEIFLILKGSEKRKITKIIRLKKKVQPGHIGAAYPLEKQFLYSIYYKRKIKWLKESVQNVVVKDG